MGGLARRVSYIKAFREKFKDIPALAVDSGYFLADGHTTHGDPRGDVAVKNEWVLKAYDQFPIDIANLSAHDLRFVSRLFRKTEFARRIKAQPILERLVSANIVSDGPDTVAPEELIIRELPDRQPDKSRPIRVAFIGLAESMPAAPKGLKIIEPIEAAKRAVAKAKQRAEIVVVLAHIRADEAARLAREVPGINAIIAGNSQVNDVFFIPPFRMGQTLVVFTPFETRTLGELRFYRDGEGKFSVRERFISLDDVVPEDGDANSIVAAAREAETGARAFAKKLLSEWMASTHAVGKSFGRTPAAELISAYISSAACAKCHTAQYISWVSSRHAQATSSLVMKEYEFDASCLGCHASGFEKGGSAYKLPALQSVQCEACHGPGGDHAAKPGKGYGRIHDMKAVCSSCHTPQINPKFDLQAFWAKIKH